MTVKVVAISTEDEARERYKAAKSQGYVTFIYEHADPLRQLASDKFVYVNSDRELDEKIQLLQADRTLVEEVKRF
jgi:hypothetical protein